MRLLALAIGGGVLLVDLLTKWWVKSSLWLHYYPVIDGYFTIDYARNTGIAFGFFHDLDSSWKPIILSLIAVIAVIAVTYYMFTTPREDRITLLALGFLLGGILGNFVDRALHHSVTDFLMLHWKDQFSWPTFNVADAAITTGVSLILIQAFRGQAGTDRTAAGTALLIPFSLMLPLQPVGDTEKIVEQLQAEYETLHSFRADFSQTLRDRGIERTEQGYVLMKRPGRMFWEYTEPASKFFVADGKKSYFYLPSENQVMISDLDLEEEDSPLLFLLGKGDFTRDFHIQLEEASSSTHGPVLRLDPRVPQPDFSYLLIEVDPETGLIRKLTVVEPMGQENEYLLTAFQPNVQIPDRQFKLDLPSNVEVIE